ncbi:MULTISPECIES: zinc-binding dehydrogenase [Streptomyces]
MTDTMQAARLDLRTGTFAVEDVPVPEPGPGQVRIEVKAAGICLSDVHLIDGSLTPVHATADKVTLGHETAGIINALGPGVPGPWTVGQRVLLQAGERCGSCAACTRFEPCPAVRTRGVDYDGGWAHYALASAHTLVALPDDLPFAQAAVIPDAVSTPWAAITTTGQVRPGRPAGVWGIGGLGTHAVQLLRLAGAAPVVAVDPLASARDRALAAGADLALDPADPALRDHVLAATAGRGLDLALDFAGVAAVRDQAVRCLSHGGRLVLVGLGREPLTVTNSIAFSYREQHVLGHYGSAPAHVEELVALARLHRLDLRDSITATLPLAEAAQGVEQLRTKTGDPVRIVLVP